MSVDTARLQQNFAKDISNLQALVAWAVDKQLHGSYSERHPDKGKMFTCPFCHHRRLQGEPKCCNAAHTKTQRAWNVEQGFHQVECDERVIDSFFSKSFMKRLTHKKHGQTRAFKIRQLTQRFQTDPKLLKVAVAEMQCGQPVFNKHKIQIGFSMPKPEHIPAFAEKYWNWKQKQLVKQERKQTQISRKINREN